MVDRYYSIVNGEKSVYKIPDGRLFGSVGNDSKILEGVSKTPFRVIARSPDLIGATRQSLIL
jgi:hypothetical protein